MSQTFPQGCYSNSEAEINRHRLKRKMPNANVHIALFVLETLLAAVPLKSSILLIANRPEGHGGSRTG